MKVYRIGVKLDLDVRQYDVFIDQIFLMTKGDCFIVSKGEDIQIFTECKRTHMINLMCMLKNNGYKEINVAEEK